MLIPDRHTIVLEHLTDERVVIMLRDTRDVAVSAAHHWRRDLTTTLHCMARGEWPLRHGGGWCKWVRGWQEQWDSITFFVKYTRLSTDPHERLSTALEYLGATEETNLIDVITRQSITARRAYTEQHGDGLNYGKEFQLQFLRKGVVGDWKNHFTPEHRRLAEGYFGRMMRELGYTESERWVNE